MVPHSSQHSCAHRRPLAPLVDSDGRRGCFAQLAAVEQYSEAAEVVVSPEVVQLIGDEWDMEMLPEGAGGRVVGVVPRSSASLVPVMTGLPVSREPLRHSVSMVQGVGSSGASSNSAPLSLALALGPGAARAGGSAVGGSAGRIGGVPALASPGVVANGLDADAAAAAGAAMADGWRKPTQGETDAVVIDQLFVARSSGSGTSGVASSTSLARLASAQARQSRQGRASAETSGIGSTPAAAAAGAAPGIHAGIHAGGASAAAAHPPPAAGAPLSAPISGPASAPTAGDGHAPIPGSAPSSFHLPAPSALGSYPGFTSGSGLELGLLGPPSTQSVGYGVGTLTSGTASLAGLATGSMAGGGGGIHDSAHFIDLAPPGGRLAGSGYYAAAVGAMAGGYPHPDAFLSSGASMASAPAATLMTAAPIGVGAAAGEPIGGSTRAAVLGAAPTLPRSTLDLLPPGLHPALSPTALHGPFGLSQRAQLALGGTSLRASASGPATAFAAFTASVAGGMTAGTPASHGHAAMPSPRRLKASMGSLPDLRTAALRGLQHEGGEDHAPHEFAQVSNFPHSCRPRACSVVGSAWFIFMQALFNGLLLNIYILMWTVKDSVWLHSGWLGMDEPREGSRKLLRHRQAVTLRPAPNLDAPHAAPTLAPHLSHTWTPPPAQFDEDIQCRVAGLLHMHVLGSVRPTIIDGHLDFINEQRQLTCLFLGFPSLLDPPQGSDQDPVRDQGSGGAEAAGGEPGTAGDQGTGQGTPGAAPGEQNAAVRASTQASSAAAAGGMGSGGKAQREAKSPGPEAQLAAVQFVVRRVQEVMRKWDGSFLQVGGVGRGGRVGVMLLMSGCGGVGGIAIDVAEGEASSTIGRSRKCLKKVDQEGRERVNGLACRCCSLTSTALPQLPTTRCPHPCYASPPSAPCNGQTLTLAASPHSPTPCCRAVPLRRKGLPGHLRVRPVGSHPRGQP